MKSTTRFFAAIMLLFAGALAAGFTINNNDASDVNWVDLGLPSGLLWADRNIGASSPEGYGDYYAWGETETKETYKYDNYKYCAGDLYKLTKYCNNPKYGNDGFTDSLSILQSSDDVASLELGDGARIPTKEEWQELFDNTTQKWWTTQKGVKGYLFTSKKNKNTLFLPAAGHYLNILSGQGFSGYYSSSSLCTDYPGGRWLGYFFLSNRVGVAHGGRTEGLSVRAVRQK